jgi:hypothetical protein
MLHAYDASGFYKTQNTSILSAFTHVLEPMVHIIESLTYDPQKGSKGEVILGL